MFLRELISQQRAASRRYFAENRTAKLITVVLFFAVFLLVVVGIYFFFRRGFLFLGQDAYLRDAVSLYAYELFFLFVSFLVFISALISVFFTLFRGTSDAWVMASPSFRDLFWYRCLMLIALSLWPLVVLVFPALLAAAQTFSVSAWLLVFAFFGCVVLVINVVMTAIILFLLLSILVSSAHRHKYLSGTIRSRLFVLGIGVVCLCLFFTAQRLSRVDLFDIFRALDLDLLIARTEAVRLQFSVFISHWAALIMLFVQKGRIAAAFYYFALSLAYGAFACAVLWALQKQYLRLWQIFQEGSFASLGGVRALKKKLRPLPRWFKSQFGAILEKEALVMVRDGKNLLWFLFLTGLWAMQTGLNFVIKRSLDRHSATQDIALGSIQALQLLTAIYFVGAFVLRFVYPSFSAERKTAWIIASAPIQMRSIFWGKFFFYVSVITLVGIGAWVTNASLLRFFSIDIWMSFVTFIVAIISLVACGISMAVFFPNLETDDPQVLSTSLPGIGFVLGSLLYGAWGAYGMYSYLTTSRIDAVIMFDVFSCAATAILLAYASRAAERVEFIRSQS